MCVGNVSAAQLLLCEEATTSGSVTIFLNREVEVLCFTCARTALAFLKEERVGQRGAYATYVTAICFHLLGAC